MVLGWAVSWAGSDFKWTRFFYPILFLTGAHRDDRFSPVTTEISAVTFSLAVLSSSHYSRTPLSLLASPSCAPRPPPHASVCAPTCFRPRRARVRGNPSMPTMLATQRPYSDLWFWTIRLGRDGIRSALVLCTNVLWLFEIKRESLVYQLDPC